MLYALVGFIVIFMIMFLILKGKATPAFSFTIIPIVGAVICGFGFAEIIDFISTGMDGVWKTAILFIFSVCFFSIMNDAGMFEPLVKSLVKIAGNNIMLIMIATGLIAVVGHIDGAATSTYLITIPVMLPIFKKMKLNPLILLLIMGMATGVMNLVPWGGPTIRAATAINMDATELWYSMIPMQIFGLVIVIITAIICAKTETRRLQKEGVDVAALVAVDNETAAVDEEANNLRRPKLFWINLILTVIVVAMLIKTKVAPYLIFLIGTMLALMINYPSMDMQSKLLKKYAPNCIDLTITLMAAGVFLGIFANSGIITSMAQVVINLLPDFLSKYLYIIMGILGAPMGLVMGPDPYYYGIMPLIIETVAPYGVSSVSVARAMLIGENVALSVSPCLGPTYLAIGMAGVGLKEHIRFSFKWQWAVSVLMLFFAVAVGII